ncbi:MAG: hypothetical protein VKK32_07515 [Candidatus Melainabacteria bacterium]|nr:hypothetical protein [Candidatus Melainabacteria bacterium]
MNFKSVKSIFENLIEIAEQADSQAWDEKAEEKFPFKQISTKMVLEKPDGKIHLGIYDRDYKEAVSFWDGLMQDNKYSQNLIIDLEFLLDKLDGNEDQIINLEKVKESIKTLPETVLANILAVRLNKSLKLNLETFRKHPYSPYTRSIAKNNVDKIKEFAEEYDLKLIDVNLGAKSFKLFPEKLDEIFFLNEEGRFAIDHNDLLDVREMILGAEGAQVYLSGGLLKSPLNLNIIMQNDLNEVYMEFLPSNSSISVEMVNGDKFSIFTYVLGVNLSVSKSNIILLANNSNVDIKASLDKNTKLTVLDLAPESQIDIKRRD